MAGNGEELTKIIENPRGPSADLVKSVASSFDEIAKENWKEACDQLTTSLGDHARLGGSRAQRDLLEFAMLSVLLRLGQGEEAGRMIQMRRPLVNGHHAVHGLAAH